MESTQKPFRLLDLPQEIRDRIYEELLCGVHTPIDPVRNMLRVQSRAVKVPEKVHQAMRSVETTILRTCKQIHREAYDIMIKANQFVQVETVDVPFEAFLLASQVPVVMMDREHASKFKGHMMHLFVACAIPTWADSWQTPYGPYDRNTEEPEDRRFTFLVRARDWSAFCQMLNYTDGFERQSRTLLNITLTVASYEDTRSEYKASISRDFYFAAQDALLKTFRTHLRGFQNVNIQGVVPGAEEILQDVKKMRWTNPQQVVTNLLEIKELAQEHHAEDRHLEAIETYMRAVSNIQRIRFSVEWPDLASDGGELFLEELRDISTSALYSKVRWVYEYERVNPHAPLPKHIYTAIGLMTPILQFDYFDAMQWPKSLVANLSEPTKPEKNQKAVSYCRQANSWRKMDDPRTMELALHSIYVAAEYAPSVNEFQEEKGRILEWIRTKFRMYLEPQ